MGPDEDMTSQISQKIVDYFQSRREVIAVYLFGSYARGKERVMSDVDIGILLDESDPDVYRTKKVEYGVDLARILRKDIDPVILNRAGLVLLRQIFSKGKCILIHDARKLARHRMVLFAKIADFGYYRRRMQSGLVRKIMEGGSVG